LSCTQQATTSATDIRVVPLVQGSIPDLSTGIDLTLSVPPPCDNGLDFTQPVKVIPLSNVDFLAFWWNSTNNNACYSRLVPDGNGCFTENHLGAWYGGATSNQWFPLPAADLNGDQNDDLVLFTRPGSGMEKTYEYKVALGQADGSFDFSGTPTTFITGIWTALVTLADADGDSHADIVFHSFASGGSHPTVLNMLKGQGDGTFAANPQHLLSTSQGQGSEVAVIANFDADSAFDVFLPPDDDVSDLGQAYIAFGQSAGQFGAIEESIDFAPSNEGGTSDQFRAWANACDLNLDGHVDLIAHEAWWDTSRTTKVYLGDGNGHFSEPGVKLFSTLYSDVDILTCVSHAQAVMGCTAVTEIPQLECEALVALYTNTDGANWNDSPGNNWNVTDTPCSWTGVDCSAGHVTTIDRDNQSLNGPIPAELGNLSELTRLYLFGNRHYDQQQGKYIGFIGSIPTELGNLSQLTELDLSRNQLSGPIPTELGNLSQLTELRLGDNQLSGQIPSELGNLTSNKHSHPNKAGLSGPIPTELGNLSLLIELDLSWNQLSGSFPTQLGNLNLLTKLDLSYNYLSENLHTRLGNLSQLTELRLGYNQLSGQIPSELGNLSQLTGLFLSVNQLSGSIPTELKNLSQLTTLSLSVNQLSGPVPSELGNLSQLTALRLDHNQLTDSLPFSLMNLTDLRYFRFNETNLCEPTETDFQIWLASIDKLQSTSVLCASL